MKIIKPFNIVNYGKYARRKYEILEIERSNVIDKLYKYKHVFLVGSIIVADYIRDYNYKSSPLDYGDCEKQKINVSISKELDVITEMMTICKIKTNDHHDQSIRTKCLAYLSENEITNISRMSLLSLRSDHQLKMIIDMMYVKSVKRILYDANQTFNDETIMKLNNHSINNNSHWIFAINPYGPAFLHYDYHLERMIFHILSKSSVIDWLYGKTYSVYGLTKLFIRKRMTQSDSKEDTIKICDHRHNKVRCADCLSATDNWINNDSCVSSLFNYVDSSVECKYCKVIKVEDDTKTNSNSNLAK